MVREKGPAVVKVKVSLDAGVHEKIAKLALDSGLSVPKFIAEVVEGLTLDATLRLLHDDPALAREVAVKALGDYLSGVRVSSSPGMVETEVEPDPEPEPGPLDEARALFGQIASALGPIAEQLGMDLPVGKNGRGAEPVTDPAPSKAQGRGGRRARPSPPRRG